MSKPLVQVLLLWGNFLYFGDATFAQSSLTLSSATAAPGSSVALNLTLASPSGSEPAAIQWTLDYPAASVAGLSVSAGSAATSAEKSIACASSSDSGYICIVSGLNSNTISNGVVGVVSLVLTPNATTAPIGMSNVLGASPVGDSLPVSPAGGTVSIATAPLPPLTVTALSCSPSTLGPSTTSTCNLTLSGPAGTSGASVALTSTSNGVAAPPSVAIPANASSATFTLTTSSALSDQTATVIATLNGSSQSTSIALVSPAVVSSLQCTPSSLSTNSSGSCAVTLSKPAPVSGVSISLASSASTLSVPSTLAVSPAASSATFSISTNTVPSDQNAIITATLNGTSANASIALVSPALVSSLQCASSSLTANSTSSCALTLSKPAPSSGASVTLTSSTQGLAVPATLALPANTSSGTFTISTASVSSDQNATITATLNGSSVNTSVALTSATVIISSLQCDATSLTVGSTTSCAVALSKPAPASGLSVAVTSSAPALAVPASIGVSPNTSSATFTVTVASASSDQTATITAALNGSSKTVSIGLISAVVVSSVKCSTTSLTSNSSTSCTVALSKGPAALTVVPLSTSSAALSIPASVTFASGATSASFTASTGAISSNQTATVTASLNGSSQSLVISLVAPETVSALKCADSTLSPNASTACSVTLSQPATAQGEVVSIAINTANLTAPPSVTVPAGSTSVSFALSAGSFTTSETVVISVSLHATSASATIVLAPSPITTLLSIRGDASEVNGVANGGMVNPAVAPPSFKGRVVINGTGSVKFLQGGGVYFLNCCGNSNNAYYKFTGSAVGDIFDTSQGQVSFTLQSRSGFVQRQAGASERYSFAAMDANGDRFYFVTQVVSGALVFKYMVQGSEQSYVVPAGSEERLFGSGVNINIAVKWDGAIVSLLLNGVVVKSTPYIPAATQWNGTSRFYVGAHEHQGVGGHSVSDDVIRDFTVAAPTSSGKNKPRAVSSTSEVSTAADGKLSSPITPAVELKGLTCSYATLMAGTSALCQLTIAGKAVSDPAVIALTSGSADVLIPSIVDARKGEETVHFEAFVRPEGAQGPVQLSARSGDNVITTEVQIARSKAPGLIVAKRQFATPGSVVQFEALAFDDMPYSLAIADLPPGATFDASSGVFRWVPTQADLGMRALTVSATNSLGLARSATVEIHIVETIHDQQPRILTVGGPDSDQALALHDSSNKLAAFPSAHFAATPARPGDVLSLFASGLAPTDTSRAGSVLVRAGNAYGRVNSIERLDTAPDVYRIRVEFPNLKPSLKTPLTLVVTDAEGGIRISEPAFIAAER